MAHVALLLGLGLLSAGRRAHAEGAAPAPLRPANALKLHLWTAEPGLRLELYRGQDHPRKDPPLDACVHSCTLWEPPGRYRLLVAGRPGSDVHRSFRDFKLARSSDLTVRPPLRTPRAVGLAMGITGIPVLILGIGYFLVQTGMGVGTGLNTPSQKLTAVTLLGGGAALTVSGWILFGLNRKPTLKLTSLP